MRWQIVAVGKPKLAFIADGVSEYVHRLQGFAPVALTFVKGGGARESELLAARSRDAYRIVLDERGDMVSSDELAALVQRWERGTVKCGALLIGGADGHDDAVRGAADWVWSLSRLTLQHELALLVALEQLYRAYTINAGLPYHRRTAG
jgi:23S rRNA (pseudouridine1915-N3)-methyltransferase